MTEISQNSSITILVTDASGFIGPYKEELEVWYVKNKSLTKYFLLILLTALAVVFPKNKIVWKVFSSLPNPAGKISDYL